MGGVTVVDDVVSTTEGRSFMLEPQIIGGTGTLRYAWTAVPQNPSQLLNPNLPNSNLVLSDNSAAVLTVSVPPDFIGRNDTSSTVVFSVTVSDDVATTERSIVLTINKTNNDTLERRPGLMIDGINLSATEDFTDADGGVDDNGFLYQWQRKAVDAGDWMDIDGAESETYTIPQPQYPIAFNYRVGVSYRDGQGYQSDFAYSDATPADYRPDIDVDDDGLIEIYYLEDLDAVRYQLDGSGYKTTDSAMVEAITAGCDEDGSMVCRGYELIRDLDFGDNDSYSSIANKVMWQPNDDESNAGWVSIGSNSPTAVSAPMMFEGNGYAISNLYQNTAAYGGLFGNIENTTANQLIVYNFGLLDVDIKTQGGDNGGLVAACKNCLIANSYVTGTLSSEVSVDTIGGLVGRATTDDSNTNPQYENVYARVNLTTAMAVSLGHLLGRADVHINNAYARAHGQEESYEGAMIGHFDGTLANGYGTGANIATSGSSTDTNSYTTSNISILKLPTAPGDADPELYVGWLTDDWDFGTSEQFPILKYNSGGHSYQACSTSAEPRTESTDQPRCGTFLSNQGIGLRDLNILAPAMIATDSVFVSNRTKYIVWLRDDAENIRLELNGYDSASTIAIDGVGTVIGGTTLTIALPNDTSQLNIAVTDSVSTVYVLDIRKIANIVGNGQITIEPGPADDGTVDEGSIIQLTSAIAGGDYEWTQQQGRELDVLEENDAIITLRVPGDFVAVSATTRSTLLTLTVSDPIAGRDRGSKPTIYHKEDRQWACRD